MFDITYCEIEKCNNWTCDKADSCKRNLERKSIPENCKYSMAHLFNICKEKNYHLYIPCDTEVKEC